MTSAEKVKFGQLFYVLGVLYECIRPFETYRPGQLNSPGHFRPLNVLSSIFGPMQDRELPFWEHGELIDMSIPYDGADW